MGRKVITLFVLLCVVATSLPAQAQIITKVERRNPDNNSGDTEPAIAPDRLAEKSLAFVDRAHVYVTVPSILLGCEYVMSANDDRDNPNYELDVTLSKAATVYLFIDNRVGTGTGNSPTTNPNLVAANMGWVTSLGFVDTGLNMAFDEANDGDIDQWWSIFSVSAPAGKMTFKVQNAGSYNMYCIAAASPRLQAYKPSPADAEEGVTMPLFQWTAGQTAVLHNVYLGLTPELGEADLVGPRTTGVAYFHGSGLTPGQTYYWRVDEIEADMATIHTGDVWSFIAASLAGWKPVPQDGSKWIDPNTTLSWRAGKDAFSHDVYFGTDKGAVENGDAGVLQGNTYFPTWELALLATDTTYYWRVDEVAPDGKKETGPVWSFTTVPAIEIADPDLLAWYKMDEGDGMTLVDWSGHGHHAALGSPAPTWALGHFGGALQFAGNGDSAACADGSFLDGLDALTAAVWIKSDILSTDKGYINFMAPSDSDSRGMRYDAAGSTGGGTVAQKVGLTLADAAGATTEIQLESSNNSATTEWQHVALVWKSGEPLKFYINGNLDSPITNSAAATGTLVGNTTVVIGKGAKDVSAGSSWDGLIDEIRIYGKALTQEDVQLVMRGDVLLAWDPSPSNGAVTDELKALPMTWQAGDKASQHDVYLGVDRAAVAAADTTDTTGIYRGRQRTTSFSPAEALEWGKQYFWRVDELNNDGTISQGFVWAFTLANYLIVDEFETYTNFSPNRVFQTWIDGWGFSEDEFFPTGNPGNSTGSMVGYDPEAGNIMETSIIHGGSQSMPVEYNNVNSPYYSETERTWETAQNWKLGGVTDLSLWFQGYPEGFLQSATGITMSSAGTDIWNTADQFRFAFKRLTGDGWIMAKVESVGNTNVWAKAGVMIRGTLDADSRFAYNIVSAGSGVSFGRREMTATAAASAPAVPGTAPYWVKLTRTGDVLKAEMSADGKTWTAVATDPALSSATVTMTGNLYIGLCVTSHNTNAKVVTTGVFSNVSTSANVTGQWQMAEIGIDSPENSAQDLYVVLQDSAGKSATVTYPNGSNVAAWTEWKIPLSQFTGVNVGAVKKMFIGLGDRKSPKPDGAGRMFFDDIRVLKPTP